MIFGMLCSRCYIFDRCLGYCLWYCGEDLKQGVVEILVDCGDYGVGWNGQYLGLDDVVGDVLVYFVGIMCCVDVDDGVGDGMCCGDWYVKMVGEEQ